MVQYNLSFSQLSSSHLSRDPGGEDTTDNEFKGIFITVTSDECHGVSHHRQLDYLLDILLRLSKKKISKLHFIGLSYVTKKLFEYLWYICRTSGELTPTKWMKKAYKSIKCYQANQTQTDPMKTVDISYEL